MISDVNGHYVPILLLIAQKLYCQPSASDQKKWLHPFTMMPAAETLQQTRGCFYPPIRTNMG
jgi:hypothetical protein